MQASSSVVLPWAASKQVSNACCACAGGGGEAEWAEAGWGEGGGWSDVLAGEPTSSVSNGKRTYHELLLTHALSHHLLQHTVTCAWLLLLGHDLPPHYIILIWSLLALLNVSTASRLQLGVDFSTPPSFSKGIQTDAR